MLSPNLNYDSPTPLYEQIYAYIKGEIKSGNLQPEEKLASKRNLARNLGVSTNTVTRAYEILIDEGYIYSQERRGYFISNIDNLATLRKMDRRKELRSKEARDYLYSFRINTIDRDNFPVYTWKRVVNSVINYDSKTWLTSWDPQGLYDLRCDIARYIRQSRDVKTSPDNIIIGSGSEYLFQLLFYILPRDSVFAIENPGYRSLVDQLEMNGKSYRPIYLEEDGVDLDMVYRSQANILAITPSHQFPTGIIMPISKRLSLLNWAHEGANNYIIEDDYDSEFKYYGRPIPALKSLDRQDKVIYMGNFSKSISPFLRISYMVLPNNLINKCYDILPSMTCPVSNLNQLSLSRFMREGYFERHLNRMRGIYKRKREALISYIEDHTRREDCQVIDSQAGLHFIIQVKNGLDEQELIARAGQEGIFVQGLSHFLTREDRRIQYPKIIIGYGSMDGEDLEVAMEKLLLAWEILEK